MRSRLIVVLALAAVSLSIAVPASGSLPAGGTFVDDDGNTHEGNIEAIAEAGITRGCNPPFNDRFCPHDDVTRGQMAAFLVRALGLPPSSGNHFVDDEGLVFEEDINRLQEAGITRGCNPPANDRFCPSQNVTRGQMAAFLVRAYRYTELGPGNRFVDDNDSIFEADIERLAAAGVTLGCNPPANDRYCPDQRVTRGQMASFLARAAELTPIVPPPRPAPELRVFASGLDRPVYVTAPSGDGRVFVVEQTGKIRVYDGTGISLGTFLDLTGELAPGSGSEKGLLSMAFHPDYAANGRFFVYYSAPLRPGGSGDHTSIIAEYAVSTDRNRADAGSGTTILAVDQPGSNHNGGMVQFGPDGYLWIGLGDGGGSNDPYDNGQDATTLLGSILRIDVDGTAPYRSPVDNPFFGVADIRDDEIWAYGLRNPWRFAFDQGHLYVADVGQGAREEVDVVADDAPGLNFGWRTYEGTSCTGNDPTCNTGGLTFPLVEYSHAEGCSVTGGFVYRGTELPQLVGHYLYTDYCTGFLRSFRLLSGKVAESTDWTATFGAVTRPTSFGVDGSGELYVTSLSGTVLRFSAGD